MLFELYAHIFRGTRAHQYPQGQEPARLSEPTARRCVFLDRDGVINEKAPPDEYIRNWGEFRFLPNIADWIRVFNALGFVVIVITNQRGIARGIMTRESVDEIHHNMIRELVAQGARIDDLFMCPHEAGTCECRKPKPGMILEAQGKWGIDLAASVMIGDSDADAALAAGCGLGFVRVAEGRIVSVSLGLGAPMPQAAEGWR